MTKPSPNKTPARRGRPPKAEPPVVDQGTAPDEPQGAGPAEAPAEPVAPAAGEAAPEQVDDANDGGFDEMFGDQPDTITSAVQPQHTAADAGIKAKDEGEKSSNPDLSDQPDQILIGGVKADLRPVPIGLVQTVVGSERTKQAGGMNGALVSDLQKRIRATDGRCAPMIFTVVDPEDKAELPKLFAGTEILAAIMASGGDTVFVVTLPQADAQLLQGTLATSLHLLKDVGEQDFVWRGMRHA